MAYGTNQAIYENTNIAKAQLEEMQMIRKILANIHWESIPQAKRCDQSDFQKAYEPNYLKTGKDPI